MRDVVRNRLGRYKRPLRYVMGVLYVVAGAMHFVVPQVYVQVVPPSLPRPLALVYLSGIAEILLGLGVLVPRTRRIAAWGLVLLLLAVFPANVYMATHDVVLEGVPEWASEPSDAATWARLPFQGVLLLWAWWYTRPDGTA
ncbi:DoxX family protein [Salinigranum salinum]|uniref:DoxX family protein n=1 Tax=Salinigranum salinum TaxID=1364937 RepID=UPI001260A75D|nr:DoxX family membrane protein [Salinigranum salinum]